MLDFKSTACESLGIELVNRPTKVLLIERLPPNAYFLKDAVKKGSGSSRRSIPNHDALAKALNSTVRRSFEFQNVQLENLSFVEQIRLFDSAAVVIGQHGAGLANTLWMQPASAVIELSHAPSLRHFRNISEALGHTFVLHRTSGPHADVDVEGLVGQLLSHDRLATMFGSDAVNM